jgi:hypothetical protein
MRINCVFLEKIRGLRLIEITDKEAPPKETGNKELEVLKQLSTTWKKITKNKSKPSKVRWKKVN